MNAFKNADVNMLQDIAEFHEKFGLTYTGGPRHLSGELGEFRENFIFEEADEYAAARQTIENFPERHFEALEKQLDSIVDLIYVALGTAYMQGFDIAEAWKRVHAANMAKVRAERPDDSKRGTTFDVVKPEGWSAPSLMDLVMS